MAETAGQRAYETYAALLQAQWPMAVWSGLSALERYAWEAAAQAVLTQALADRVWARQAPSSRWQETPKEETPDA